MKKLINLIVLITFICCCSFSFSENQKNSEDVQKIEYVVKYESESLERSQKNLNKSLIVVSVIGAVVTIFTTIMIMNSVPD